MKRDSLASMLDERFDGPYEWLAKELERLFDVQGGLNHQGTLNIGLNPKYGPCYSACVVHGPLVGPVDDLPIFEPYVQVLRRFNGASLHAITLYGIPEEQSNQRRCLSLISANRFWINAFRKLPPASFHFGSRTYSWDENLGYFYDTSLRVFSARKCGEIVGSWPTIEIMLRNEWDIARELEIEMRNRLNRSGPSGGGRE